MNVEKISYYISNPQSIDENDIDLIYELKEKYPYSSSLHILYLKALANARSTRFEEELRKSSIQVNDREHLHNLIQSKPNTEKSVEPIQETKSIIEIKEPINDVLKSETKQDNNLEIKKNIVSQEQLETKYNPTTSKSDNKPDMAKIIEEIRIKAENARLKNEKSIQQKKIESLEKANKPTVVLIDNAKDIEDIELENEIIPLQTEIQIKTPIIDTPLIEKKDDVDIDIMAQAMEVAFELDVENIIREVEISTIKSEEPFELNSEIETTTQKIEDLSFTDWLKYKQGQLKIQQQNNEELALTEKVKLTKNEVDNLLDKFILNEPKMARPKKEFFNPITNAKKSLDENEVLISETLAKIYWNQKNYDKAIKAYEQLSLLYPNKSTTFANLITKIRKELNQK